MVTNRQTDRQTKTQIADTKFLQTKTRGKEKERERREERQTDRRQTETQMS